MYSFSWSIKTELPSVILAFENRQLFQTWRSLKIQHRLKENASHRFIMPWK